METLEIVTRMKYEAELTVLDELKTKLLEIEDILNRLRDNGITINMTVKCQ